MTSALKQKAQKFADLHTQEGLFVMPNAWDEGSAKFLAAHGFEAIATTSGGVNWSRGREDYVYQVPAAEMLEAYGRIADCVDVPVSGDLEDGYGAEPEKVAETIHECDRMGIEVLPPDINESFAPFSVVPAKDGEAAKIRFGLTLDWNIE